MEHCLFHFALQPLTKTHVPGLVVNDWEIGGSAWENHVIGGACTSVEEC
jgi:hypothetical protein